MNIQIVLRGLTFVCGSLFFCEESVAAQQNKNAPVEINVQKNQKGNKNQKHDDANDLFGDNRALDIAPNVTLAPGKKEIVVDQGQTQLKVGISPVKIIPSTKRLRLKDEDGNVIPQNKLVPLWKRQEAEEGANTSGRTNNKELTANGDAKTAHASAPSINRSLLDKPAVPAILEAKSNAANDASTKASSSALRNVIKGQESAQANGVIVPTGSALFELRNIPGDDAGADKEPEDIADVRLMQKLIKEKKAKQAAEKARELKERAVVTQTKDVARLRKDPVVAKQAPIKGIQLPPAEDSNKLTRVSAEIPKDPKTQKLLDNEAVRNAPIVEKVIYEEKDTNKPHYEIVECDVVDVNTMTAEEKEKRFYSSESYKQLPASVIVTSESPQIKFSGSMCSHLGAVMQDDARSGKDGDLHVGVGWADLSWEVSGSVADTLFCKYVASLQVVPGDVGITDHYVQVECPYGTFQMGNVKGPDGTYADDATGLVGGTGGVDGSMWGLFSRPSGFPQTHHAIGYTKRATKVVYHSPRWVGFQVGLGYCPNPAHQGWGDLGEANYSNSNDDGVEPARNRKHNLAFGMNYQQDMKDLEVTASLVAIKEKTSQTAEVVELIESESKYSSNLETTVTRSFNLKEDTSIHATGAIKYKSLKIAGGYINNGEQSMHLTKENADTTLRFGSHLGDAGRIWNVGGKYSVGGIDVGYARHKLKRRVTNSEFIKGVIHALSFDFTVASGVQVFAELDRVNQESGTSVSTYDGHSNPLKNKGTVLLVGSKLSF
jgi:hypothetical protein